MKQALILIASFTLLAGCLTPDQKIKIMDNQRKSTDDISRVIVGVAKANPELDQSKLAEAEGDLKSAIAARDKQITDIQAELAKQRLEFKQFLTKLSGVVGTVFPAVAPVMQALQSTGPQDTDADKVARALQAGLDEVLKRNQGVSNALEEKKKADEKAKELARAQNETKEAKAQTEKAKEEAKAEAAKKECADKLARLQEQLSKVKEDLEKAQAAHDKSKEALEAKLKDSATSLTADVAKLKAFDKEEFRKQVLEDAKRMGLSKEDIEKVKGMSDTQLMGLLGGGGGLSLAALAALFRTFGPSRGQKEVDELFEKHSELQKELARFESTRDELAKLREKHDELTATLAKRGGGGTGATS